MAATQKLLLPFAAHDAMVGKGTDVDGSSSNKYWMFFIPRSEENVNLSVFLEARGKHFSTAPVPIIIKLQLCSSFFLMIIIQIYKEFFRLSDKSSKSLEGAGALRCPRAFFWAGNQEKCCVLTSLCLAISLTLQHSPREEISSVSICKMALKEITGIYFLAMTYIGCKLFLYLSIVTLCPSDSTVTLLPK